jgi:hypothetical protein
LIIENTNDYDYKQLNLGFTRKNLLDKIIDKRVDINIMPIDASIIQPTTIPTKLKNLTEESKEVSESNIPYINKIKEESTKSSAIAAGGSIKNKIKKFTKTKKNKIKNKKNTIKKRKTKFRRYTRRQK